MNKMKPLWIKGLKKHILKLWESPAKPSFIYERPSTDHPFWKIFVFPSIRETIGGPEDGAQENVPYIFDIQKLMSVFKYIECIRWDSRGIPDVRIIGKYKSNLVAIALMAYPHDKAKVRLLFNPITGKTTKKIK